MNTQPEALLRAQLLEFGHLTQYNADQAAAELRRLHEHEVAYTQWLDKTEWVQDTAQPHELGMHRADVIKQRFDRLHELNQELVMALRDADDALVIHAHDSWVLNQVRAALAKAQGLCKGTA